MDDQLRKKKIVCFLLALGVEYYKAAYHIVSLLYALALHLDRPHSYRRSEYIRRLDHSDDVTCIADEVLTRDEEDATSPYHSATCAGTKRRRSMLGDEATPELTSSIKSLETRMKRMKKTIDRAVKRLATDDSRNDMKKLNKFLETIEGLSQTEKNVALLKLPKKKDNLVVLYELEPEDRLHYVRMLLEDSA